MDQLTFNRVPLQESPPVLGKPIEVGPGVARDYFLLGAQSDTQEITMGRLIPFYTYGPDWVSPRILQGVESPGPDHGTVDHFQLVYNFPSSEDDHSASGRSP